MTRRCAARALPQWRARRRARPKARAAARAGRTCDMPRAAEGECKNLRSAGLSVEPNTTQNDPLVLLQPKRRCCTTFFGVLMKRLECILRGLHPTYKRQRLSITNDAFGYMGIVYWDAKSNSYIGQPCYKLLTRDNIAIHRRTILSGICSKCLVRGTRTFHNVHQINQTTTVPSEEPCFNCKVPKTVTNCSVISKKRKTLFSTRCFTCNALHQAEKKSTDPLAFIRSRAHHVTKRARRAQNHRLPEVVNPDLVVDQIHAVFPQRADV